MLTEYIDAAMRCAHYELIADEHPYYGSIPDCKGVWANKSTLEECRNILREVLEDWIVVHLYDHAELPVFN